MRIHSERRSNSAAWTLLLAIGGSLLMHPSVVLAANAYVSGTVIDNGKASVGVIVTATGNNQTQSNKISFL